MIRLGKQTTKFYTGEGFKGEKFLAITAVVLTIASTLILIHVTLLQKTQIEMEIEALNKKKELEDNKQKT